MWDLAVREEDYDAAETMVQRYVKAPLSFRIVPAYARGDSARFAGFREDLRALDARQSQIAARYMATYLEDFAAAEELARLDLQPRRNAAIRLGAQTFLAWLEVARGRWTEAARAFDAAERIDGGQVVRTDRAIAAALPFLEVPSTDVDKIRRDIEAWDTEVHAAVPPTTGLAAALRPHLRVYLLGLLSSRLEENDRAMRHAQELERLPVPDQARSVVAGLSATVRADVALRSGRPAEALSVLQSANGEVPLELVYVRPFVNVREYTQEHARFLRAEALLALGRHDEARRWLETSFQGSQSELVFLAPVHHRLATVYEQRGDQARAAKHYRSFTTLWRDSDPSLQARVKAAEAALRRLGAS
jgi:tetratricopeptide (TPR) repeat protein